MSDGTVNPGLTRRPTETDKSWGAFLTWVQQGIASPGGRPTFTAHAKALGYADHSQVGHWAADHDWIERATAYDQVRLSRVEAAAESLATRQLKAATRLLALAEKELTRTEAAHESRLEPMSPSAAAALLKESVQLIRLVSGESTENVSVRGRIDLRMLSDQALEEIKLARNQER